MDVNGNTILVTCGVVRVAEVRLGLGGEPEMTEWGHNDLERTITFNDLEIIQDNWNQLQEMQKWERRRKKKVSVDTVKKR